MPDDLRDLALATPSARASPKPRPALLIEQDHLVIEGDVALRPAKHLDRGRQLAARLERERFDPAEDLDAFGGDPTFVLPPSRHPLEPPACVRSAPRGPSAMRGAWAMRACSLACTCEGRPGRIA